MKVILIAAQSLDGKIAHAPDEPAMWTSKEDKRFFAEETKKHGVVIVGRKTYETIGRPLPERLNIVLTTHPIVEDNQEGVVEFTNAEPRKLIADLSKRGFLSVAVIGGASVYTQFLREGLVDELMITIEPKLFGRGIPFVEGLMRDVALELIATRRLNTHTLLLHYNVMAWS